jgi:hypothetical protein
MRAQKADQQLAHMMRDFAERGGYLPVARQNTHRKVVISSCFSITRLCNV